MRRNLMMRAWVLLTSAVVVIPVVWAVTHGPDWTIGRAVIVKQQRRMSSSPVLYLKLSLRNIGSPGQLPVRIYGRWSIAAQNRRWGSTGWRGTEQSTGPNSRKSRQSMPKGMRLLGLFDREVNLNQTAILSVPLTRLGVPQRGTTRLEVVVTTASSVTDHRFVALMANQMPIR
jgi:hypothetical protein